MLPHLAPALGVRVVHRQRRIGRQRVRVADVSLVGARIDEVRGDPLARRAVSGSLLPSVGCGGSGSMPKPEVGQLADANRRVRQRRQRVQAAADCDVMSPAAAAVLYWSK